MERDALSNHAQHRRRHHGDNPKNSVVNKYLQSWDVPNVFSMGAGAFPQNAGYNPTATVAALAYQSAAAIISQYLKAPGPWCGANMKRIVAANAGGMVDGGHGARANDASACTPG